MKNPINWFELPVNDMDRAKLFYETILDIEITIQHMGTALMGWFPFEPNGAGATGTLMKGDTYVPSHHGTMVYFSVPEIDDVISKIETAGGKIINGKFSLGEHGFAGHFEDSEGNRVALHQAAG
ncbi:MAG: VOC family protein [Cyclobacteriaceae bacterium]